LCKDYRVRKYNFNILKGEAEQRKCMKIIPRGKWEKGGRWVSDDSIVQRQ
jgi:hypothetical protein